MTASGRRRLTKRQAEQLGALLSIEGGAAAQVARIMATIVPLLDEVAGGPRPWPEHAAALHEALELAPDDRDRLQTADAAAVSDPEATLRVLWDVVAYLNEMRAV